MIKKYLFTAAVIFAIGTTNNAHAAKTTTNYSYTPPVTRYNATHYSNLQGYASYVPAGVTCSGVLSNELNSQSATIGQTVEVVLTEDFLYNSKIIAPSGSIISGTVVSNAKAGFATKNAEMQIRFTTIRTPYNNIIPISATIATNDSTGVLKGGTKKDSAKTYAKDTVIGAGAGAALGTAMGALSGGSVGMGAVYGTAIGSGIGIIKGIASKGGAITIPANSRIDILFDQPITMSAQ